MKRLELDSGYMVTTLMDLLAIPSPTGHTDEAVRYVADRLDKLGIPYELTRRGAIRADVEGGRHSPDRAIVAHLDTLGAMVKEIKPDGRLRIVPVGSWSSRFAEGARVTVLSDESRHRGAILPIKASGHTYGDEIDKLPISWETVELRVDERILNADDVAKLGIQVGDFIAVDPQPEITESGFICSRHLDDKVGVAAVLGAAKAMIDAGIAPPVDCHLLFTISEEVGSGASAVLHGDVAELIAIDNATQAKGQSSREYGVTIPLMDSSGPFDYHLTRKLLRIAKHFGIEYQRDVFQYYRTDAAAAVEAGNDIRCALLCFGLDASHGYERTHLTAMQAVAEMIALYMQSPPIAERDEHALAPIEDFPESQGETN
ncbi:MAG: osmoprotectant NAGGN system M42 family peptidase [Candidatus Eiseniibacteriota bacterium]